MISRAFLVVAALLLSLAGCCNQDKAERDRLQQELIAAQAEITQLKMELTNATLIVEGKVTYQDKPLTGGLVIFHGVDGKQVTAPIKADGTYEAKDVPLEDMKVTVSPEPRAKGQQIPAQYTDPKTTPESYLGKSARPVINIAMK